MRDCQIPVEEGRFLEARLHENDSGDLAVLLLHPHGGLGGSMRDVLIYTLFNKAVQRPRVKLVLAYNQAGVGGSSPCGRRFWQQECDSPDLEAVLRFMSELGGEEVKFVIAGYSYGACVAASAFMAASNPLLAGFVIIAPPIGFIANAALGTRKMLLRARHVLQMAPALCLHGTKDQFASVNQVEEFLKAYKQDEARDFKLSLEVLPQADHFFCDRQSAVANIVYEWISAL